LGVIFRSLQSSTILFTTACLVSMNTPPSELSLIKHTEEE